ncbi:hypothetical protein L798_01426 [Zootermopsis nevadensis]|uniref:Uncharacterized protein n=1 Tax=Zootermopsis nevadensis TaxID=136037 RepID=A0A067RF84_ZOONE|nr:hypothetical protein L798_01426 [Zootermopsis nevadensis]
MTTKDLFINNCCYWEAVKTICKCFPELDIIPPLTFIIEAIYPIYACTFMVTP